MTEKIRLEVDDATAAGIDSVDKNLGKLEGSAGDAQAALNETAAAVDEIGEASLDDVVAGIEKLTESLQKDSKVIHEHTASWTQFGATAIPAIASITDNVLRYSLELGKLVAEYQAVQTTAKAVATSQQALNIAKDQGAKAAVRIAGAMAGYAEAVSGVLAVLATVKVAQAAYNTLLENTGKSADGLTNNLTRTREANSALWDDIKATAGAGAEAVKDWGVETVANAAMSIGELTGVSAAWKEIDRSVTESTNNYVNNTRVIGEAIRGVSRDAVKASQDIAKAQAEAADDFDRVRLSNDEIAQAAKDRAEAERLASIDTVDAINAELQAMQQRRGEAAATNNFSEEDQKRHVAAVGSLEQRRTQITKREADERDRILKHEADERARSDQANAQRYEDARNKENDKILDEYRQQAKADIDARKAREKEVDQFIQREYQKIVDEERKKFDAMQQAAKARLDLLRQERQARIDAAANGTSDEGKALAGSRSNISQDDLRKQVVEQAKARNRAEFRPQGDDARTFGAQRNRAERQAGIDAFRQFNAGKTDQADIASAQNSLINTQLQAAQGRGDLDQQTANALMQAAQNQQQMIQTQQQQAQVIRQIQAALNVNGNAARNTNAQARKGLLGG